MSKKISIAFLSGLSLGFLLGSLEALFLLTAFSLSFLSFPGFVIIFALLYDLAFWQYKSEPFFFLSLLVLVFALFISFVKRRFLW